LAVVAFRAVVRYYGALKLAVESSRAFKARNLTLIRVVLVDRAFHLKAVSTLAKSALIAESNSAIVKLVL
jgi:hypothetical protein